ncbi:ubiquitin domain containing protein [Acanthamoeba castellanii str. Neff]|uniref:Ubiquitin domain containing protein n=1 Tax=Acanthamoeba castellanii (strain ATCC 30010 / Neff) TaxID=1257118 RepID=L8GIE2_ACACF|nr:ubiquitin domain containing protein [Acanthamoeba castellanii str. Neff]ELR11951.1 ubiquitin domain containing protein [Acanthamoeba castellanii str. Neff]
METKGGEAPSAEMFRVNVKTLDGKVHPVEVAATTTISEFKAKISTQTNVAPTAQRLIFQGKVLKDDQTVGSAGLTIHMVERPPEAQTPPAGAAPTGAPLPTPMAGGHMRPASIVMGTFSLPNQTGGAPPALDNLINSVLGSLGVPMQTTSIRVTAAPSNGQAPNENAVWGPVENMENHLQQSLNTLQGTQTAEAEQYQAQGRAARRLLALADLMDRASPVWRRLAQAAVRLPI